MDSTIIEKPIWNEMYVYFESTCEGLTLEGLKD